VQVNPKRSRASAIVALNSEAAKRPPPLPSSRESFRRKPPVPGRQALSPKVTPAYHRQEILVTQPENNRPRRWSKSAIAGEAELPAIIFVTSHAQRPMPHPTMLASATTAKSLPCDEAGRRGASTVCVGFASMRRLQENPRPRQAQAWYQLWRVENTRLFGNGLGHHSIPGLGLHRTREHQ